MLKKSQFHICRCLEHKNHLTPGHRALSAPGSCSRAPPGPGSAKPGIRSPYQELPLRTPAGPGQNDGWIPAPTQSRWREGRAAGNNPRSAPAAPGRAHGAGKRFLPRTRRGKGQRWPKVAEGTWPLLSGLAGEHLISKQLRSSRSAQKASTLNI